MKKFLVLTLTIVTAIGITSCSKDALSSVKSGEQVVVEFTASLGGIASRAVADGQSVNEIAWAVYREGERTPLPEMWGTAPMSDKQASLSMRLVTGKKYDLVFFAYYTENPTTEQTINGTIAPKYYTVELDAAKSNTQQPAISVIYDNAMANDDKRDCFWHVEESLKVEGPIYKTFTLTRPLAQLNLGITQSDFKTAVDAGFTVDQTTITTSSYPGFNIFDGTVFGNPTEVVFQQAAIPDYKTEALMITTVNDANKEVETEYEYLATTYVLVNEKTTTEAKFTLYDDVYGELNTLSYSYVPLQRNYRTNIIGNVLTNPAIFTIVIDNKFNQPDYIINHWDGAEQQVAEVNGTYTITTAAELAWIAKQVNSGATTFVGKTVVLANDIDLNNTAWMPIGDYKNKTEFLGTFDGNDKTIANLYVKNLRTDGSCSSGLFGHIKNEGSVGKIMNLTIKNATIDGHHWVGAIVGHADAAVIESCKVINASIICTWGSDDADGDKAGAIAGFASESNISNCSAENCTIEAVRDAGQLFGAANKSYIDLSTCSATNVTVTGTGANIRNELIGREL